MENFELPVCGEKMWVISPCSTVEQVTVNKVTYVETYSQKRIDVKTSGGDYRMYKLYRTKEIAKAVLYNKQHI